MAPYTQTLKRIGLDGKEEQALVTFPHATRAVLSPDLRWVAFREYHRTFVAPYEFELATPLAPVAPSWPGIKLHDPRGEVAEDYPLWDDRCGYRLPAALGRGLRRRV